MDAADQGRLDADAGQRQRPAGALARLYPRSENRMRSCRRRDRQVPVRNREQNVALGMRALGQEAGRMAKHGEIGMSTTESELRQDIQRRETGRISLLNALKAVAEQSTSHARTIRTTGARKAG